MKQVSKLLALILALCMVLSVAAFASAEPSAEPASAEPAAAASVEDAFIEYIHNWLLAELNVNSNMTIEQIINCVNAGGYSVGIGEWRPEKDGDFGRFHIELS